MSKIFIVNFIAFSVLIINFLFVSVRDVDTYNSVVASKYDGSWYSNNWFKQPYTMFKLMNEKKREFWTKNAIGEDWFIREIDHKGAVFWTILYRGTDSHN